MLPLNNYFSLVSLVIPQGRFIVKNYSRWHLYDTMQFCVLMQNIILILL